MTIRKTNPLTILAKDPTGLLLHAEPKVGKTTLAGSFPGSTFVSCPGDEALALAILPNARDIVVYQVDNWDDFCGANLSVAKKPVSENCQTQVLDTASFAYQLAVEDVKSKQTNPEKINQSTWTFANRKFLELLDNVKRECYTTGKNLVVLCHSREVNIGTEENPIYKTKADVGNSLRANLYARFNSVFHLRMIGTTKRELLMKPTPGIDVGSRYRFDKNIEQPTGTLILEAINEYKAKRKADNG